MIPKQKIMKWLKENTVGLNLTEQNKFKPIFSYRDIEELAKEVENDTN